MMQAKSVAVALFGVTSVLLGTDAHAALARYNFTGNSVLSSHDEVNSTATALTGAGLSVTFRAAGTGAVLGGNPAPGIGDTYGNIVNRSTAGGASVGNYYGDENFASSEAASVAANDYYQFSVKPAPSYELDLLNLTFDLAIGTTGSSNGITFFVRSDAGGDNFTTTLGRHGTVANAFSSGNISLAGSAFQNLTSEVFFRLYAYDRSSSSNTSTASAFAGFYLDNVVVNGSAVLIPEPASLVGLIGATALLMGRRRR